GRVPHLNRAIQAAGRTVASVSRRKGEGGYDFWEGNGIPHSLAKDFVPDLCFRKTRRGEVFPVCTEGHQRHALLKPQRLANRFARRGLPKACGFILAARDKAFARWIERDRGDSSPVLCRLAHWSTCLRIPELG